MIRDPDDLDSFLKAGVNDGRIVLMLSLVNALLRVACRASEWIHLKRALVEPGTGRLAKSFGDPSRHGIVLDKAGKLGVHRIFNYVIHLGILLPTIARTNDIRLERLTFPIALRLAGTYETICPLSSDANFVSLLRCLKTRGKKTILIKGGRISGELGAIVDLKVNALDIKRYITVKKQKPGF